MTEDIKDSSKDEVKSADAENLSKDKVQSADAKDALRNETRYATFGMCLFIGLLLITVGHLYHKCTEQQEMIDHVMGIYASNQQVFTKLIDENQKAQASNQEAIAKIIDENQKTQASNEEAIAKIIDENRLNEALNEARKIYVYSLEDVLLKVEVLDNKKKFEDDILNLNKELLEGEEKIKNIKNAKLKEDFSDVYLKNLRMKRDELVANYQKSIEELTKKINQSLAEIAQEKKASVVFLKSAIAVTTPDVVDLTDEVAERVQKNASK